MGNWFECKIRYKKVLENGMELKPHQSQDSVEVAQEM